MSKKVIHATPGSAAYVPTFLTNPASTPASLSVGTGNVMTPTALDKYAKGDADLVQAIAVAMCSHGQYDLDSDGYTCVSCGQQLVYCWSCADASIKDGVYRQHVHAYPEHERDEAPAMRASNELVRGGQGRRKLTYG